jgi:Holliday junction resolvase-like predicted endonuclease
MRRGASRIYRNSRRNPTPYTAADRPDERIHPAREPADDQTLRQCDFAADGAGGDRPPNRAAGDAPHLGALFESLVTQSVRVYADAMGARVGHLRTRNTEQEIDLIVEGDELRVVAIEVKLANAVSDADVRHLNWLHQSLGDRVAARVVVYTGKYAYRRADGVAVVPLALLGP